MIFKESQQTELKESIKSSTIINEIVAFLNTCDGIIDIGVKNDGTLLGIEGVDHASLIISNMIVDQIEPNPMDLITVDTPYVEGKSFLQVHVKKGNRLYYIKKYGMSSAGCYERIGTSSRRMTPEQIQKRFLLSLEMPKMKMTEVPCGREYLTFAKFKGYLAAKGGEL